MDDRFTAIHLEVRLEGESPVGHARTAAGASREFAGWLGLVAVLEALLEAGRAPRCHSDRAASRDDGGGAAPPTPPVGTPGA